LLRQRIEILGHPHAAPPETGLALKRRLRFIVDELHQRLARLGDDDLFPGSGAFHEAGEVRFRLAGVRTQDAVREICHPGRFGMSNRNQRGCAPLGF